jgi:hypothetical protein
MKSNHGLLRTGYSLMARTFAREKTKRKELSSYEIASIGSEDAIVRNCEK